MGIRETPEERKAYDARWREAHREHLRQYKRKWRAEGREKPGKFYSAYDVKTEMPLIIYAPLTEVARVLGSTPSAVARQELRQRKGATPKRYMIFMDEEETDDKD